MYMHDYICATAYVTKWMVESRILQTGRKILDSNDQLECPDRLSPMEK